MLWHEDIDEVIGEKSYGNRYMEESSSKKKSETAYLVLL